MSRFTLRASCSTLNPNTSSRDWVNYLDHAADGYDPERLTVFVGEKKSDQMYSALASSGGLLAPQHFKWENLPVNDRNRLFILQNECTVTLDMELVPKVGSTTSFGSSFQGTIPSDSIAINLNSMFGQGASDAFMHDDVWAKLAYYDTGRLGRGICFNPSSYFPPPNSKETRGVYLMGGALPDFDDSRISLLLQTAETVRQCPSLNFQCGRDLSFISQCNDEEIVGIGGYWSLGHEPTNPTYVSNQNGRIFSPDDTEAKSTFQPWMNFGTPTVGYPSALDASTAASSSTIEQRWQGVNPIYGRPACGGSLRPGNCLAITPSMFFTDSGFTLLTNNASNPGGNIASPDKVWTTYFSSSGTSSIRLTETQPFKPECPLFNTSMNIEAIPYLDNGLDLLVPITRIHNGLMIYTPMSFTSVNSSSIPTKTGTTGFGRTTDTASTKGKTYPTPTDGLTYVWFEPVEVKMTINIPVICLENSSQTSSYFNELTSQPSLYRESSMWFRWFMESGDKLSSTASVLSIQSNQLDGPLTFTLTARNILEKVSAAFSRHNVSSNGWPVNRLMIEDVIVSASTKAEMFQYYNTLLKTEAYKTTPQGSILLAGGCKTFTRNGCNLCGGAPRDVRLTFIDADVGETIVEAGYKVATIENVPKPFNTPFNRANDFCCHIMTTNAGATPALRIPNINNSTDDGGVMRVEFQTDQYTNLPWSGPKDTSAPGGGIGIKLQTVYNKAIAATDFAAVSTGWFNKMNPFSQDYDASLVSGGTDKWTDLDSRIVDFNRRAVEIWIKVKVEVPIYLSNAVNTQNTDADNARKGIGRTIGLWAARR